MEVVFCLVSVDPSESAISMHSIETPSWMVREADWSPSCKGVASVYGGAPSTPHLRLGNIHGFPEGGRVQGVGVGMLRGAGDSLT